MIRTSLRRPESFCLSQGRPYLEYKINPSSKSSFYKSLLLYTILFSVNFTHRSLYQLPFFPLPRRNRSTSPLLRDSFFSPFCTLSVCDVVKQVPRDLRHEVVYPPPSATAKPVPLLYGSERRILLHRPPPQPPDKKASETPVPFPFTPLV